MRKVIHADSVTVTDAAKARAVRSRDRSSRMTAASKIDGLPALRNRNRTRCRGFIQWGKA
jgi:hypothetical protein